MIKKIVLTGPESSGKTTLAKQLSEHLGAIWVPEYARQYITTLKRSYRESDLVNIAKGQLSLEELSLKRTTDYLICDTDLLTIKIWSLVKFGRCNGFVIDTIEKRSYDLYLLCSPDIPWEYDPQRENPNDRSKLYDIYKKELEFYGKNFSEIKGNEEERLKQALEYIQV